MREDTGPRHEARSRTGFSIVEVLVALVLVTVGLLGVAGNCALAIRVTGAAARERQAAQRASDRLAALSSQGCASARSGTAGEPTARTSERWTVGASGSGAALVDAEVRWQAPDGERSMTLRGAVLC